MKDLKKYITVLFVMACAICVVSCSEDTIDNNAKGSITGTVVLEGSNEPIADVKISTNPSSSTVFTSEDGTFVINNVLVGDYAVQADKEEFVTDFEQATVLEGDATNVIFELQPQTGDNTPPTIPELLSPVDGAINVSLSPTLEWSSTDADAFDTVTYRLELRNDITDEIEVFENIIDTTFVVPGLSFSTKYFWQVQADDGVNTPVNSGISSFETTESPNNRILYVRKIDGNNVIFSTSETGENDLQLTSENNNSWRPRQIAGSDRIAFLQTVGNFAQIFTMNEDGSGQQQVTENTPVNGFNLDELDYTFGSDGLIYYPNFGSIYSINLDGTSNPLVYSTADGSLISEIAFRPQSTNEFAIKTNDFNGYTSSIDLINIDTGVILQNIHSNLGAAGGLDFSIQGTQLLYTFDILDNVPVNEYRPLDSRAFIYDFVSDTVDDISEGKEDGTNDLDPRFSPTDARVIITNRDNDLQSIPKLVIITLDTGGNTESRDEGLKSDASMPDWE